MPVSADEQALVNRLDSFPSIDVVTVPSVESRPWWTSLGAVVALVVLGTLLRGAAWLGDRNLWIDESMLALNLIERSPARLLEPLDWNQGAPVGFLLASKAAIGQLGTGERALRFLPMLGSLWGLFGFAWLAPRLMSRPAAMIAIAIFSISPVLVSYSAECKQYATDASIAVGLFAAAASLLHGESGARRWAVLAGAGACAVWFSHPAVFVLGGIGTALFAAAAFQKDRTRLLATSLTIGTWLVSFAACYFLFLRNLGNNSYLITYWDGHFLPLPPKSPGDFAWLLDHFFAPFAYPGGMGGTEIRAGGIAAAFFLIGVRSLWKDRWPVALAIVLPGLFALLASGLHKYPFAGRLLLFLVPLLILGTARGAAVVASALAKSQPIAAIVLLGVLLAAPCLETYQQLNKPMRTEQLQPVLAQVRERWQPGDRLYVYYGALPAFEFYSRDMPFPTECVVKGTEARSNSGEYRQQLAALHGQPRVWLVFSHRHKNEESILVAYAEGLGRCEETIREEGAAAYRFNFQK